ncbi:hypothetical protein U9M48_012588, partial [Paspalum notatum var. saurae]
HIVEEISILGPVFLHNLFPFERYISILKKYVHKRSSPEGCIAKGYETEEANLVFLYHGMMEDLARMRTLGTEMIQTNDNSSFDKAHSTVTQQSSMVGPYIEEHKKLLVANHLGNSEAWITCQHIEGFPAWLQLHLMRAKDIDNQLAWLARGPSSDIVTFQGYEINGYTFYTRAQDRKSTNQNSGIRIDAIESDGNKDTYYGCIDETWEL